MKKWIAFCLAIVFGWPGLAQTANERVPAPPPLPLSAWKEYFPENPKPVAPVRLNGKYYEAEVPDTLDLAERARLSLNNLTRGMSGAENYYDVGYYAALNPKYAEAQPMMRVMCGSDLNLNVEQGMMQALVKTTAKDGLFYCPADVRARQGNRGDYPLTNEPFANVLGNGRMMLAMMAWQDRDHDPEWQTRLSAMARGLDRIAIKNDDYAFYPEGRIAFEFSYLLKTGWKYDKEPMSESEGAESTVVGYQGAQVRGLACWAERSGDKQALELARKITNFLMLPKFWDPGTKCIVGPEKGFWSGHFHGRCIALRGMLAYAQAANDHRVMEFVRAAYEYGRSYGVARMGWFPAWAVPNNNNMSICETCATADMTALAVHLTRLGLGDYWDDVDAYVRNQLTEQQYTNVEFTKAAGVEDPVGLGYMGGACGGGGFSCIPDVGIGKVNVAQCCSSNFAQTLYVVWDAMLQEHDGDVQVNLLLNRAGQTVDVDSYIPYAGKVVIRNKNAHKVSVRIPYWVRMDGVKSSVNGETATPSAVGRYLVFDQLKSKDAITIEFPQPEETVKYSFDYGPGPKQYTCSFKGSTLIDIAPRASNVPYPIYQREQFKNATAPMKTVKRYLSDYRVEW